MTPVEHAQSPGTGGLDSGRLCSQRCRESGDAAVDCIEDLAMEARAKMADKFGRAQLASRCPALAGLVGCLLSISACTTFEQTLSRARLGDSKARGSALGSIEDVVREARPGRPGYEETREKIDRFLRERFPEEPDAVYRSQILAMAVQGEFDCASDLLVQGARDRKHRLVRLIAIQSMRDDSVQPYREVLVDTLQTDRDLLVRIETVKTLSAIERETGDLSSWATPLVQVLLDETEDPSLRLQAYEAVKRISGESFHFEQKSEWKAWLDALPAERALPGGAEGAP